MKVLLVGGGAREHAMAAAIKRSSGTRLCALLKTPNPGILALADDHVMRPETDLDGVLAYAHAQRPDVVVVGPEAPLEKGLVDRLEEAGFACASPSQAAARIETDKTFMRRLMQDHRVPGRLDHARFDDLDEAVAFLDEHGPRWAIKPVGLTGGKGVQVFGDHFEDVAGAKEYTRSVFASGTGGGSLQFEELAVGEEFTVMAFTDGRTVLPMPAIQDHKRLFEGDQGPNTGGMGAYSQADGLLPFLQPADREDAVAIVQAIVDALRQEGSPYTGTIYGQFMLTAEGPRVIEVNARFGDPEAMNALHLLESDYPQLLQAMAQGTLHEVEARFVPAATVVRYMVPRGYGQGSPEKGAPVHVDEEVLAASGATLYYANIDRTPTGALTTLTSRTLAVLGEGPDLQTAEARCSAGMQAVQSDALVWRRDIGTLALIQQRIRHMQELRGQTIEQ